MTEMPRPKSNRFRDTDMILIAPKESTVPLPQQLLARTTDAEDFIEGTLTYHDRHQFEVKLAYILPPGMQTANYRVQAHFFVPRPLDINARTYTKEQFYRNLQDYIRFKTPSIALDKLVDPENKRSPLRIVHQVVENLKAGIAEKHATLRVTNELKLFGCIFRSGLRDGAYRLISQLQKAGEMDRSALDVLVEQILPTGNYLLDSMEQCLETYRAFRTQLLASGVPSSLIEDFEGVDEYLSMVVEEYLNQLYARLKTYDVHPRIGELLNRTAKRIHAEEIYRRGSGYLSVIDPETAHHNEFYTYRRGSLKKYISSVLYLHITHRQDRQALTELGMAIAAGVAMFVAIMLSMWANRAFHVDSSWLVGALVVAYMIKDRVKEWGRSYLGEWARGWVADFQTTIIDRFTKSRVGRFRQYFRFVREAEVSPEVLKARHRPRLYTAGDEEPEVILFYEKEVSLDVRKLPEERQRFQHFHDILRFNVSNFLFKMDEPTSSILYLEPKTQDQIKLSIPKVYHVNVVLRLLGQDSKGKETSILQRVRLILTKEGIKRVEEVSTH